MELIAGRDKLEEFCKTHGSLLQGKVIIYKHLEHWRLSAGKIEAEDIVKDEGDGPSIDVA